MIPKLKVDNIYHLLWFLWAGDWELGMLAGGLWFRLSPAGGGAGTTETGAPGAGWNVVPGLLQVVSFLGFTSMVEPRLQRQVSQEKRRSKDLRNHRGPL